MSFMMPLMDGLNAEFMADPEEFLKKYPVGFKYNSPLGSITENRVDDFDLSPGSFGAVELELFANRGRPGNAYSKKIRAYWLPFLKFETAEITLKDDAPFFFTAELTGCRIQVGGDANPTVLHITGYTGTREWREAQAREHLGDLYDKSVRYSKSREDGYSGVAFVCGYWDDAGQRWRILAQQSKYADRQTTITEVRILH